MTCSVQFSEEVYQEQCRVLHIDTNIRPVIMELIELYNNADVDESERTRLSHIILNRSSNKSHRSAAFSVLQAMRSRSAQAH